MFVYVCVGARVCVYWCVDVDALPTSTLQQVQHTRTNIHVNIICIYSSLAKVISHTIQIKMYSDALTIIFWMSSFDPRFEV